MERILHCTYVQMYFRSPFLSQKLLFLKQCLKICLRLSWTSGAPGLPSSVTSSVICAAGHGEEDALHFANSMISQAVTWATTQPHGWWTPGRDPWIRHHLLQRSKKISQSSLEYHHTVYTNLMYKNRIFILKGRLHTSKIHFPLWLVRLCPQLWSLWSSTPLPHSWCSRGRLFLPQTS